MPRYFNHDGEVLPKETYLPALNDVLSRYSKKGSTYLPPIDIGLRRAAFSGNQNDVETLLEDGAPINGQSPSNGKTAMHYARENGDNCIVQLLKSRGADLSVEDNEGVRADGCSPSDSNNERLVRH